MLYDEKVCSACGLNKKLLERNLKYYQILVKKLSDLVFDDESLNKAFIDANKEVNPLEKE